MWLLAYFDLLLQERLSFFKIVDIIRRFVKTEFSKFNIITTVNAKHLKLKMLILHKRFIIPQGKTHRPTFFMNTTRDKFVNLDKFEANCR